MKFIAVIAARLNSSRLPAKQLLPLAGKPLIERIFQRLENVAGLDDIILATTADDYNQPLIQWAQDHGREVYAHTGNVNDVVARVDAVVQKKNADAILFVCGDSPLIDPITLSRIVNEMRESPNLDLVTLEDPPEGKKYIHEGFSPYSRRYWDKMVNLSITEAEKEYVGISVNLHSLKAETKYLPAEKLHYLLDHRISVDTMSDYDFMCHLYDKWYEKNTDSSLVSINWVIDYLSENPQLMEINKKVLQRQPEHKPIKAVLLTQCGSKDGIGHLKRLFWLAKAMQDHYSVSLVLHILGESFESGWLKLLPHTWYKNEEELYEKIADTSVDVVIYDLNPRNSPHFIGKLIQKLNRKKIFQVAVDGLLEYESLIDLYCVPSHFESQEMRLLDNGKKLAGWDYFLMDYQTCAERRKIQNVASRLKLLVLTGGADASGMGRWLPGELDEMLPHNVSVSWIQGPFADEPDIPSISRLNWKVIKSPNNLRELMCDADFAISRHGVSFFELAAYKVPTLLLLDDTDPISGQEVTELCAMKWVNCLDTKRDWKQMILDFIENLGKEGFDTPLDAQGAVRLSKAIVDSIEAQKVCS